MMIFQKMIPNKITLIVIKLKIFNQIPKKDFKQIN